MAIKSIPASAGGTDLVRHLAADGFRIFTVEEAAALAPAAGISRGYLNEALHRLARTGWIVRLRKGLYAISSVVPGVLPVHEFDVAMALMEPAAISHWSAMLHHGLTRQVPMVVFVSTSARRIPRRRGAAGSVYPVDDFRYRFVQTKPERFFGTEEIWVGDARVTITDPERTLVDGLMMPQHCGDLADVLHAFDMRGDAVDLDRILAYALRLDDATVKRLGWVLERRRVSEKILEPLQSAPIKGYRRLDASGPAAGPRNRRWMLQENLPGTRAP